MSNTNFSEELDDIQADVTQDLGTIINAVKQTREKSAPKQKHDRSNAQAMTEGESSKTESTDQAISRPTQVVTRSIKPAIDPEANMLVNVTTRLTKATNDRLTEAALRQRLAKKRPDSRQSIVEIAILKWLDSQLNSKP